MRKLVCRAISVLFFTSLVAGFAVPMAGSGQPAGLPSIVDVRAVNGRQVVAVNGRPFYPLGVTYHFTRHRGSWERDLSLMRQVGLNTVRADFGWRDVAPLWEGHYQFDVVDAFLNAVDAHGLKVVLVFSHATGDVNIPPWFMARYVDWGMIRDDGRWIWSAQPSVSHPDYRRLLEDFIRRTVAHIRGHPALLAYQILNEPSYHPEYLADYNPYTIAKFRDWLAERYGDIAALDEDWLADFTTFAETLPPGRAFALLPPGGSKRAWRDWREFSYENLADFVELLERAVHEEDRGHPVVVAEMSWWWWGQQPSTGVSPWHVYRSADIVGYDVYPEEKAHALYYALNSDMLARYWGKPVWVTELNRKDGRPSADDLQAFALAAVSYGATGIFYFAWQDDWLDGGSYGLLDFWGRPKAQFGAFAQTVAWLSEHEAELLAGRPPEPDVVVVWPTDAIANSVGRDSPALTVFRAAADAVRLGLRVGVVEQQRLAALDPGVRVINVPR